MSESLPPINKFNVRVYGLLVNDKNEILVADEIIRGNEFTKFPGGGLEYEESPLDCLKREFIEELNQPIEVVNHFYTTDQFVRSAFRPWEQVISIYHWVKLKGEQQFKTTTKRNDFNSDIDGDQESFRWEPISRLDPSDFSFLIDSHVVGLIKSHYQK